MHVHVPAPDAGRHHGGIFEPSAALHRAAQAAGRGSPWTSPNYCCGLINEEDRAGVSSAQSSDNGGGSAVANASVLGQKIK